MDRKLSDEYDSLKLENSNTLLHISNQKQNDKSSLKQFIKNLQHKRVSTILKRNLNDSKKNNDIVNLSREAIKLCNNRGINLSRIIVQDKDSDIQITNRSAEKEKLIYAKDGSFESYSSIRNVNIDNMLLNVCIESERETRRIVIRNSGNIIDLSIRTVLDGTDCSRRKFCQASWDDISIKRSKGSTNEDLIKDTISFIKREYETKYSIYEQDQNFRYKGFEESIHKISNQIKDYIDNEISNAKVGKTYTEHDKLILNDNIQRLVDLYKDMGIINK